MREMKLFIFLCDQATESECLKKLLVGTTQTNSLWAATIRVGDEIYLFNFNTGVIRGPYSATSGADCLDPGAWGGRFPIQVRISKTSLTRHADNRAVSCPATLRKRRPNGDLGTAATSLFSWLQEYGKLT
jgi:hypothetical protein